MLAKAGVRVLGVKRIDEQRIATLDAWEEKHPKGYNVCWCGARLRSLLVTPSVVRDIRDANLLGIWQAALEDLRRADSWTFIGYSLPSEDIAIRSVLLRAMHSRRKGHVLRVRVIQREATPVCLPSDTLRRFRVFFPATVLRDSDYKTIGVEHFVRELEQDGTVDV